MRSRAILHGRTPGDRGGPQPWVRTTLAALAGALSLAVAIVAAVSAGPACAQSLSTAVVQPLPGGDALRLNAALGRLGRDPRDVAALIDAGDAALAMGDTEAAAGFFKRADQVSPNNPRVLAGTARALVRGNDPVDALAMFDRAEQAGAKPLVLAADRGLAYDLVGDNDRAQRTYRVALASGSDGEVVRRLALSQAIAGDPSGSEATLLPLLRAQDKAAWRSRVFILAILGQTDEATSYATRLLPPDLAAGLSPYLRYMPRLTRAQQAAAAMFGVFPRAAEIGHDEPRIASFAASGTGRGNAGSPLAGTVPLLTAAPILADRDANSRARLRADERVRAAALAVRVAPPEPLPARSLPTGAPLPSPPRIALGAAATPASVPSPAATARPRPATVPARGMADAFADLGAPSFSAAPAAGAVDITRIASAASRPAPRPAGAITPQAAAKAPPSHPSRIWVQLGVGHQREAMLWDWKRMLKDAPDAFKGRRPFSSDWGQTNRMLTGPFASEATAADFVMRLRRAGVSGPFTWISPAGQIVDALTDG